MPFTLVLDIEAQESKPLDVNFERGDPDFKTIIWLQSDAYAKFIAAAGMKWRVWPSAKSRDARLSERIRPFLIAQSSINEMKVGGEGHGTEQLGKELD